MQQQKITAGKHLNKNISKAAREFGLTWEKRMKAQVMGVKWVPYFFLNCFPLLSVIP